MNGLNVVKALLIISSAVAVMAYINAPSWLTLLVCFTAGFTSPSIVKENN